mmetsp:Transcript_635/g.1122  ORF Transcript_635/g.1122 Transcript_635/m.1122 type:complete len:217 (+) Transcript_635:211-861(+)
MFAASRPSRRRNCVAVVRKATARVRGVDNKPKERRPGLIHHPHRLQTPRARTLHSIAFHQNVRLLHRHSPRAPHNGLPGMAGRSLFDDRTSVRDRHHRLHRVLQPAVHVAQQLAPHHTQRPPSMHDARVLLRMDRQIFQLPGGPEIEGPRVATRRHKHSLPRILALPQKLQRPRNTDGLRNVVPPRPQQHRVARPAGIHGSFQGRELLTLCGEGCL